MGRWYWESHRTRGLQSLACGPHLTFCLFLQMSSNGNKATSTRRCGCLHLAKRRACRKAPSACSLALYRKRVWSPAPGHETAKAANGGHLELQLQILFSLKHPPCFVPFLPTVQVNTPHPSALRRGSWVPGFHNLY